VPLGDFLHALVAIDGEHERSYVSAHHLGVWGVPAEAVWAAATEQLAGHATAGLTRTGSGFRLACGDGYTSSRLLLPGWARAFADGVPGVPLFLAPDEDELVIVGADDPALPVLLRWAFSRFRAADRPLCPAPLTADLQPWSDDRAGANLRLLHAVTYAEQVDLLQDVAPEGTRIAGLSLIYEPPSHTARTRASWSEAPITWLPLADEVLREPGGDIVPFASLGLTAIPGVRPPRFREG
jgi:hypothetical protein